MNILAHPQGWNAFLTSLVQFFMQGSTLALVAWMLAAPVRWLIEPPKRSRQVVAEALADIARNPDTRAALPTFPVPVDGK